MPRIQYPNVPNVSGVPQVLRSLPAGPPAIVGTAAGIAQLIRSFTSKPVWGVFKPLDTVTGGEVQRTDEGDILEVNALTVSAKRVPVVTPDSIVDFGFQKEWSVTSAPTQNGSFVDYNRVNNAFEIRVRMTKGRDENTRAEFIKEIEALDSTQLYDIITPEKTYTNCNIIRFEISRRGEKGAFWLSEVDLYFREIRTVTSKYTNTVIANPASSSAANVQNNGTQQGQSTTATVPTMVSQ